MEPKMTSIVVWLCAILAILAAQAGAATYVWDGGDVDDANWDSPDNWTADSGFPDALGDVAQLTGNVRTAVALNGNRALGSLEFTAYSHSGSQPGFVLDTTSLRNTLTLADGGTITSAVGDWYIPAPVIHSNLVLNGAATIQMNINDGNNKYMDFTGTITGSGPLTLGTTLTGTRRGYIRLGGTNTSFSGQVTIDGAMAVMNNTSCFGTNSTVNLLNDAKVGSIRGSYNYNFIGSGALYAWGGVTQNGTIAIANGMTATLDSGGGNSFNWNGAISGQGTLALVGGSTNTTPITLGGAASNTFSGGLQVRQGYAALNKTAGLDAVACDVTVAGFGLANNNPKVLRLANDNQIKDTAVVTLGQDGTGQGIFRMNGRSDAIGGLASGAAGSGIVENESGASNTAALIVDAADGATYVFSGVLRDGDGSGTDGVLAFEKKGLGTQVLSGTNTYSGATTVSAGLLRVDGSLGAGSSVTVTGGSLGGAGTVNGPLIVQTGGGVAPGLSPGALALNASLLLQGSYDWELGDLKDNSDGAAGSDWDLIVMNGAGADLVDATINLAGLTPSSDPFWQAAHTWTILSGAGQINLTGGAVTGYDADFGSFVLAQGNGELLLNWEARSEQSDIPEPATLTLLVVTAIGLTRYRRRRSIR